MMNYIFKISLKKKIRNRLRDKIQKSYKKRWLLVLDTPIVDVWRFIRILSFYALLLAYFLDHVSSRWQFLVTDPDQMIFLIFLGVLFRLMHLKLTLYGMINEFDTHQHGSKIRIAIMIIDRYKKLSI